MTDGDTITVSKTMPRVVVEQVENTVTITSDGQTIQFPSELVGDLSQALELVASSDTGGDWRDDIQTRDAVDEEECPECGAEVVQSLGSGKSCPMCGWSE